MTINVDTKASPTVTEVGHHAERVIAQSLIVGTVLPASDYLLSKTKTLGRHTDLLTDSEMAVLDGRYNYIGWFEGALSTAAVFGVLFGGFRYAAYQRFRHSLPLSTTSAMSRTNSSIVRKQYTALDGGANTLPWKQTQQSKSMKDMVVSDDTSSSLTSVQTENVFQIFGQDVWSQLQLFVSSCAALLVGTVVSSATLDEKAFYRDLAELPRKPGRSYFCQHVCPQLVAKRNHLLAMDTLQPLHEEYLREKYIREQKEKGMLDVKFDTQQQQQSKTKMDESIDEYVTQLDEADADELTLRVREQNPAELWNFPITDELDSVVKLVQHCEHRMAFEEECRRRRHRIDEATGLVDVPAPGVPGHFIRLNNNKNNSSEVLKNA